MMNETVRYMQELVWFPAKGCAVQGLRCLIAIFDGLAQNCFYFSLTPLYLEKALLNFSTTPITEFTSSWQACPTQSGVLPYLSNAANTSKKWVIQILNILILEGDSSYGPPEPIPTPWLWIPNPIDY